jgi:hypothetical protein
MKALTRVFLLVCLVASHAHSQRANLIQSSSPFNPTGIVSSEPDAHCTALKELSEQRKLQGRPSLAAVETGLKNCADKGPIKIERGVINGVSYRFYYSDGSGSFAGEPTALDALEKNPAQHNAWTVGCEKDPITDAKACYIDRDELRVWVDSLGRSELYIGSQHYPNSLVVIRIDNRAPIAINSRVFNGSFGYQRSPAIIKQMIQATAFTTRYQEWPYRDYADNTQKAFGLKEALAYIRWAVARIR